VRTILLPNLFIEFVHNDRDKQVHNEEGCNEDENDEHDGHLRAVIYFRTLVRAYTIYNLEKDLRPVLKSRDLEEGQHRIEDVVEVSPGDYPVSVF
jgi:hypothetical protein